MMQTTSPDLSQQGGCWEPNAAMPMVTSPEAYPLWSNPNSVVAAAGTVVQYQYLVFSGGKFQKWEPIDTPRTCVATGFVVTNHDTFGVAQQHPVALPAGTPAAMPPALPALDGTAGAGGVPPLAPSHVPSVGAPSAGGGITSAAAHRKSKSVSWGRAMPAAEALTGRRHRRSKTKAGPESAFQSGTDGVIIVQYTLPVILTKTPGGAWAGEWDDENLLAGKKRSAGDALRLLWVGVPNSNVPIAPEDRPEVERILAGFRCAPVFLPPELAKLHYEGYCKDTIWPVFHNIVDVYGKLPSRWWNKESQEKRWQAYTQVNQQFARTIIQRYHDNDIVWIHDYPLLLVPSFLARTLKSANVGLFLHTPFPSSEIFRSLSVRDELLRGMLNADHIGFHLFEYARHFLTACRRILGLSHVMMPNGKCKVDVQGREVILTVSHVSVEPDLIMERMMLPSVLAMADTYRKKYAGRKIIVGIDNTERLKGIPLKLHAYDSFLETHPEWRHKVVLVQFGIKEKSLAADCGRSQSEVEDLVAALNAKHGGDVPAVEFLPVDTVRLNDRLPLWMAADVLLTTSIRDGLNLLPLEFVVVHRDAPAVLVVSEFTGSGRVLTGALPVNPWQQSKLVDAIHHSLVMDDRERLARHKVNVEAVSRNTTTQWAERILLDIKSAAAAVAERVYAGYGLGLGFRVMGVGSNFQELDVTKVAHAYRRATRRVFFLDYGGTLNTKSGAVQERLTYLMGMQGRDRPVPLTDGMFRVLKALSADPRNTVFVVSGKEKRVLLEAFTDTPNVGLAAEHGFYYRWGTPVAQTPSAAAGKPSTPLMASGALADEAPDGEDGSWHVIGEHLDFSWQDICVGLMEVYSQRTNGTFVLRKGSCVLWHYGDADPDFGDMQAKELQEHLSSVMKHFTVDVLCGKDYVEVRPKGVNKGVIAIHVLDQLEGVRHTMARDDDAESGDEGDGDAPLPDVVSTAEADVAPSPARPPPADNAMVGLVTPVVMPGARPVVPPAVPVAVDTAPPAVVPPQLPPVAAGGSTYAADRPPSAASTPSLSTSALSSLVPVVRKDRPVDFVMAIGDDTADEHMFAALVERYHRELLTEPEEETRGPTLFGKRQYGPGMLRSATAAGSLAAASGAAPGGAAPPPHFSLFTVTVGKKPSTARFYVNSPTEVQDCLSALTRVLTASKWRSTGDLQAAARAGLGPRVASFGKLGFNQAPTWRTDMGFDQFMGDADDDEAPTF